MLFLDFCVLLQREIALIRLSWIAAFLVNQTR